VPIIPLPAAVDEGEEFGAAYDAIGALSQSPEVAAPESRTLVAGVLSLNESRNVWVETEGSASLDQLEGIDLDTLPQNLTVRIRQADADHVVDIVHLFNSGAGGGEFSLNAVAEAGGTIRLDSLEKSVTVVRRGSTIYELERAGFAGTGGFDGALLVPLDGGDQTVWRLRWNMEDILFSGGEYTVQLSDSGKWKNARSDGKVKFPNPNATGSGWQAGHNVSFQQWGTLLTYVNYVGSTPNHPLNHDRGMGVRSVQHGIVCEENDGTLAWLLTGMTAAEDDGGGGGGGGAINRSYAYTNVLATVNLPVGSTAFVNCGSITFTPAASADYLIFCDATFSADAVNTTNNSEMRLVNTTAPSTALCEVGRPRQASQEHRSVLKLGATFGASPSAQTYRIEAANGSATTHSTRVEGQSFVALKLETDEGYAAQSGVVADTNQTYDVVATKTMTLPAGTYVFGGQFSVGTASDHRWSGKLTVGGTDYNETAASNINPGLGLYDTFRVLTHAGGSVTFSTSIKSGGSGGTATATHGIVWVLAAARFQVFDSDSQAAESGLTTSTTLQNKISKATALQSGWRTLVLASMQAHCAEDATGTGVAIELQRNNGAIGTDAEHGSREQTGQALAYSPMSWGGMGLMAPALSTDTFTLKYAAEDETAAVKVASASIVIVALSPL
jgi:hypothetical protein